MKRLVLICLSLSCLPGAVCIGEPCPTSGPCGYEQPTKVPGCGDATPTLASCPSIAGALIDAGLVVSDGGLSHHLDDGGVDEEADGGGSGEVEDGGTDADGGDL
jgi:hypothetical protein